MIFKKQVTKNNEVFYVDVEANQQPTPIVTKNYKEDFIEGFGKQILEKMEKEQIERLGFNPN